MVFTYNKKEQNYINPLIFLLSMSFVGLEFFPAYIILFIIVFISLKTNRYNFVIQLTLLGGVYGFYDIDKTFPFKFSDIILILFVIYLSMCKKTKIEKKIIGVTLAYITFLLIFALLSDESLYIQFRRMRRYWAIVSFSLPLLFFYGRDFSFNKFINKLYPYIIIISIFYILDSFILGANVFIPRTAFGIQKWDSLVFSPFSYYRIYPQGIYLVALIIFPICNGFIINSKFEKLMILLGLLATKTMSIIFGLLLGTFFSIKKNTKKILIYSIILTASLSLLFIIDNQLGGRLRIVQFTNQISSLFTINKIDDLSSFGSNRGAQIIPKINNLIEQGNLLYGFGFTHDKLSTNDKFAVFNDMYVDDYEEYEIAGGVEVTQIQTILDIGIIGLLIQCFFFYSIYIILKENKKYSGFYKSIVIIVSLFGLGGFAGLIFEHGLYLVGLVIGGIILNTKQNDRCDNFLIQ